MNDEETPKETPAGAPQALLDQEDEFTKSLLQVAYTDPTSPKATAKGSRFGKRNSKFWFQVESIEEEVKRRKAQFKPKVLEHVDEAIESRLKPFKDEFPRELRANINAVREFFLKEVAPLTVAASAGTSQAREVVERLMKTKVDTSVLSRFENMVGRAAVIKMGLYVLEYFHLPPEHLSALFGGNVHQQDGELQQVLKMLAEMQRDMKKQKITPQGELNVVPKRNRAPRR